MREEIARLEDMIRQKVQTAEQEARAIGKRKGILFRRYDRWGTWPIKAYSRTYIEGQNDFKNWYEALDWVKGID